MIKKNSSELHSPRHRKSERIASIVGDSFADHKDERALMAAMIDELSKGTRWRKDVLMYSKAAIPDILMVRSRNDNQAIE